MTIPGIDYSQGRPSQAVLQGYSFACRYVGFTDPALPQTKILTLSEAQALSSMGLSIVSNYEWYDDRAKQGYDAGAWDAKTALVIHTACGGPNTAPIYFSVDFLPTDMTPIAAYFHGIASNLHIDRIGAYGPYDVIKFLSDEGLITWKWQTYAWSNGQWFTGNHIEQYSNGVKLSDGTEVDLDRALVPNYGQWSLQAMASNVPDYKTKQFDDVWYAEPNVEPIGYKSGIYVAMLAGFQANKFSACFPLTAEIGTEDWSGNAIKFQAMSNGLHAEYRVSDGSCKVYDAFNNVVFQH